MRTLRVGDGALSLMDQQIHDRWNHPAGVVER
jgi:hypothetical protein